MALLVAVMRTQGSLRLILNTKLWAQMQIDKASEKSIRITAMDTEDQGVKVFLISVSSPGERTGCPSALPKSPQEGGSSAHLLGHQALCTEGVGWESREAARWPIPKKRGQSPTASPRASPTAGFGSP